MENNYYVYAVTLDNTTLYIGHGTGERYKHGNSGVSHVYELNKLHFSGADLRVIKLHTGLTKDVAREIEIAEIKTVKPKFNVIGNKIPMTAKVVEKSAEFILHDMGQRNKNSILQKFISDSLPIWIKGGSVLVTRKHEDSIHAIFTRGETKYFEKFKEIFPDVVETEQVIGLGVYIKLSSDYLNDVVSLVREGRRCR